MVAIIVAVFVVGYLAIVLEHPLRLNKSASALLTGVLCWSVAALLGDPVVVVGALHARVAELSEILFFLLGAMTIVELIDGHDGFRLITARITTLDRRRLLVIVAGVAFVLSALLDNLTTAILMMSLVRKLVREPEDRRYLGGIVIIAANAGGAWSPVGDVTTTMLWIGDQITSVHLVTRLLVPALVSVIVPVAWGVVQHRGVVRRPAFLEFEPKAMSTTPRDRKIVLSTGLGALGFVPIFKAVTHLPPFMGVLLGVGVLWAVTEVLHRAKPHADRGPLSVTSALQRVDSPSILFFLGILLAIGALQSIGVLHAVAGFLDRAVGDIYAINVVVGLSSAVIDNVPLVGAMQAMYPLTTFATDHPFWILLAYCAGTGGSILIIGSAAGIAVMGLEQISFGWYLRKLSLPALLGYLAGALCYLAGRALGG